MEKEKKEMVLKAINELKPTDRLDDFINKTNGTNAGDVISCDDAELIFQAYQKGCNEYNSRALNAEDKYHNLCIKVCEKYI